MGIWANAFKLPKHPETTPEEKELLSKWAGTVRSRRMEGVASLSIEATRPLHGLGAQALVFLQPVIGAAFGREEAEKAVKLLENPKAVDFFIKALNGDEHVQKRP